MLSALFKAFTGRAGWLASFLALLMVALIAYAVVDNLAKVQQQVLTLSQDYLDSNLADGDTLMSLQVDGRDVHLGGEIQNPEALQVGLTAIQGVRRVVINGAAYPAKSDPVADHGLVQPETEVSPAEVGAPETSAEAEPAGEAEKQGEAEMVEVMDVVSELLTEQKLMPGEDAALVQPEATEALPATATATGGSESATVVASAAAESQDQSSLALRYDGARLTLSGHVADAQMAKLLVAEVNKVIPPYSTLEADVDGQGTASSLNWMRSFLRAVSGLPKDAQGLILGSDKQGVRIIPDTEQMLATPAPPAGDEDTSTGKTEEDQSVVAPVLTDLAETADESSAADEAVQEVASTEADVEIVATGENIAEAPETGNQGQAAIVPAEFIVALNRRLAEQHVFAPGAIEVSDELAEKLAALVELMHQNPSLLLRIVGNIDYNAAPEYAEYVGIDRARAVRGFLRRQQVEGSRIYTAPLPRDYAFDQRVQLVFYISE